MTGAVWKTPPEEAGAGAQGKLPARGAGPGGEEGRVLGMDGGDGRARVRMHVML